MDDFTLLWKRLRSLGAEGKIRNDEWLARVKLLRCVVCSNESSECHHFVPAYQGMRCSDYLVVPVCRKCHTDIHLHENESTTRMMLLESWIRIILKYMGNQ